MESDEITQLLRRASAGDASATHELLPLVYAELRRLARRHLQGERRDHTLQATALVNEAYLKIFAGSAAAQFPDRAHFLAFASTAMRHILIDHARLRQATKRGGDLQRVPVDDTLTVAVDSSERLISILDFDAAIEALAEQHPSAARAIEMRYFGGMTAEETAHAVGQTVHVVQHDLRFAHAWLRRRLAVGASD